MRRRVRQLAEALELAELRLEHEYHWRQNIMRQRDELAQKLARCQKAKNR